MVSTVAIGGFPVVPSGLRLGRGPRTVSSTGCEGA